MNFGSTLPPLVVSGIDDGIVAPERIDLLVDVLETAGGDVTARLVDDTGHGFDVPELGGRVGDFFRRNLR